MQLTSLYLETKYSFQAIFPRVFMSILSSSEHVRQTYSTRYNIVVEEQLSWGYIVTHRSDKLGKGYTYIPCMQESNGGDDRSFPRAYKPGRGRGT